jgi:hypothetical protein
VRVLTVEFFTTRRGGGMLGFLNWEVSTVSPVAVDVICLGGGKMPLLAGVVRGFGFVLGRAETSDSVNSGDNAFTEIVRCGLGATMGGGFPWTDEGCLVTFSLLPTSPAEFCSNILTSDFVGTIEEESVLSFSGLGSSPMLPSSSLAYMRSANRRCMACALGSNAGNSSIGVV